MTFINRTNDKLKSKFLLSTEWKRIATGFLVVIIFVLLSKIAGALKEMTIAWKYGTGDILDAYLFILTLITWPLSIWFSILSVVLIPILAKMRTQTPEKLILFYSELLGFSILIGFLLMMLIYIVFFLLLNFEISGLPRIVILNSSVIVYPLITIVPLGILIGLFSVQLLSRERHQVTLFETIPSMVLCLVVFYYSNYKYSALIWGTILGYIAHTFILTISLVKTNELPIPRLTLSCSEWSELGKGLSIVFISQALIGLGPIFDQFFAANLGKGSIASLGYANRLLSLILSLASLSISRATLPVFSNGFARCSSIKLLAVKWTLIIFVGSLVVVFISWFSAYKLVSFVFEHGAFNSTNTHTVANLFQAGLCQIPFYASSLVLVSYLASSGQYIAIFFSGILGLLSKVAGNYLLIAHYGNLGIMYSYILVYFVNLIFFIIVLFFENHKYTFNLYLSLIKDKRYPHTF